MDTPWFQTAFSEHYLTVYPHRSSAQAFEEIQSLLKAIPSFSETEAILDLCCGSGRHLQALESLAYQNLTGFDLSQPLLKVAQKSLTKSKLVQGDMRFLPFEKDFFGVIFQFFTSFGYFSDAENQAFLQQISALLKPKGIYVLDYLNPNILRSKLVPSSTTIKKDMVLIEERHLVKNRVEKKVSLEIKQQKIQYTESVRLYNPKEMKALFEKAGFHSLDFFGDFAGNSFQENSERMILLAIKQD